MCADQADPVASRPALSPSEVSIRAMPCLSRRHVAQLPSPRATLFRRGWRARHAHNEALIANLPCDDPSWGRRDLSCKSRSSTGLHFVQVIGLCASIPLPRTYKSQERAGKLDAREGKEEPSHNRSMPRKRQRVTAWEGGSREEGGGRRRSQAARPRPSARPPTRPPTRAPVRGEEKAPRLCQQDAREARGVAALVARPLFSVRRKASATQGKANRSINRGSQAEASHPRCRRDGRATSSWCCWATQPSASPAWSCASCATSSSSSRSRPSEVRPGVEA